MARGQRLLWLPRTHAVLQPLPGTVEVRVAARGRIPL